MYIVRSFTDLYSAYFPYRAVCAYRNHNSSLWAFLKWLWTTRSYRTRCREHLAADRLLGGWLLAILAACVGIGIWLLIQWARFGHGESWAFGLALLLGYPLVVGHMLVVLVILRRTLLFVLHPKALARAVLCAVLEHQVRQLRRKHRFTVVAVAGSVGKTTTKLAIAHLLGQSMRVRFQAGNYNDRATVPLVFFGQTQPSLFNIFAWLKLIGENAAMLEHPYPYDVVVVELGTDRPGQMAAFAYLKPDVTVLTAITPEHMEFFGTLNAVAAEELTVFDYSHHVLVNADDTAGRYLGGRVFTDYSLHSEQAKYYGRTDKRSLGGQRLQIQTPAGKRIATIIRHMGDQGAKCALAAAAVGDMLGMNESDVSAGLAGLTPFAGRMQLLEGYKGSTLIDDTYNATPVAVKAALDVLYAAKAPQRIAILGSMAELGHYTQTAHAEVGEHCRSDKLDMVVTVGEHAKMWLAPAAKAAGCTVHSYMSPYDAGAYVRKHLKKGAIVLAKGSQNGVFTEEALKVLLAHPADVSKLVRQSHDWLRKKARQFEGV